MTTSLRMDAGASVLVLVDYQERLMPAMHEGPASIQRAAFLARVAAELGVPAVETVQNPSRLGDNPSEITERVPLPRVEKMTFGACEGGLDEQLGELDRQAGRSLEVVIAGCETHVCLLQTALGLLEAGRRVWVVADACASRHPGDRDLAYARLSQAGATLVSAEMVAFEWLRDASHPRFKAVSALVKEL